MEELQELIEQSVEGLVTESEFWNKVLMLGLKNLRTPSVGD